MYCRQDIDGFMVVTSRLFEKQKFFVAIYSMIVSDCLYKEFQKVNNLSDSMDISYKSSIQPMGQVLEPSRPWAFMQTPQT